jgi:hypothetical protein
VTVPLCTVRIEHPPPAAGPEPVPDFRRPAGWFTAHAEMSKLPAHIHAHSRILTQALSTFAHHGATFSIVMVGNQIAEYLRLSRPTQTLWTAR